LCAGEGGKEITTLYVAPLDGFQKWNKPFFSSRIARWPVLFAEYDIKYMTMKALKGSAITDHLADNAVEDYKPSGFEIFPIKIYCQ
jgi:hypothetical protein